MNKNVFLVDLSKCLGFMTDAEREDALEYYKELFDEAGPENEQKVLAQLGSPMKVAVELHRTYDRSHADTTGAERLMRGNFAVAEAEEAAGEEKPAEEVSVKEALPAIEDILKEVSSMDEPHAEESVEESAEAERVEAEASAADKPAEEEAAEPAAEMPEAETASDEPEAEAAPAEKSEPVFVDVPVPARAPAKPEEKPEPEAEPLEQKRGMPAWAIALVLVFTCWLWIPIFASLLCIAICVGVIPLAVGLAFVGVAGYLVICAIWALSMITDALLMLGAAAIALAFGIVLLWLGIWAMVQLIRLLLRGTAASYRGIFGRGKKERAK